MKPRSLTKGALSLLFAAYSAASVDAAIDSSNTSNITKQGTNDDAIYLENASGSIKYSNSGNLTTGTRGDRNKGSYSSGIDARNSGTGGINLTNSGNITTHGDHAAGISANVSATAGHIHITHQAGAKILTTGTFDALPADWSIGGVPAGIIATNGTGQTGNITITVNGDIETSGAGNRLHGIYALSSTIEGSTNITITGNIKTGQRTPTTGGEPSPITNANQGNHSNNGIVTSARSTSMVTVDGGSIETLSDCSIGISSGNIGSTGNAVIKVNSGSVTTRGYGSRALSAYVSSGSGNVQITSNGTITTEGSDRKVEHNGTTSYSHAIYLSNTGTGQSILALGEDSVVTTRGNNARGVTATTESGAIYLGYSHTFLQGSITTMGDGSTGIYAESASGTIAVNNNADVTTSGNNSAAIYATGSKEVSIVNSGNILTQGQYSGGISGRTTGLGDLTITHLEGALLITEGEFSAPPANWLYGEVPAGIIASNSADSTGNIIVNAYGDIETRGEGNRLRGIYAFNSNSVGDTTINASGNITTGRETPDGAVLDDDMTGRHSNNGIVAGSKKNTTVNYSTNKIQTNSDLSTAISVSTTGITGNAAINVDSGTILALGDGSGGLYAGVSNSLGTGDAIIHNNGSVTTEGTKRPHEYAGGAMYYSHGIRASNAGTGNTVITTGSDSVIKTAGEDAYGIYGVTQSGSVLMGNSTSHLKGTVETSGANAHGIFSQTAAGNSKIYNDSTVNVTGANSQAVRFQSDSGRAELYNYSEGVLSGHAGVYINSGVNGGTVWNRGTITGTGGNAIIIDGSNVVIDVTPDSIETGKYVTNGTGNSLALGGGSGSRRLNELGGTGYFDSITKTGNSEWIIANDITLAGNSADALMHKKGRLIVDGNIALVNGSSNSRIYAGAVLAGTGHIGNMTTFEDDAVFEVNFQKAFEGGHMTVNSGYLDGSINILNWATEALEVDTYYVVLESMIDSLNGQFDWRHGVQQAHGLNIYEMRYTENEVQLWIVGNLDPIPEPSTYTLGMLGLGLVLFRRKRKE